MKKTILFAMMAVCSMNMQAQFSGQGTGTEKDPYQVTNADELFEVRNDLSAFYKQMNDIDLETWIQEESPGKGWPSIGTATSPFMGYYDGNNKSIKGLKIFQRDNEKEFSISILFYFSISDIKTKKKQNKFKRNRKKIKKFSGII